MQNSQLPAKWYVPFAQNDPNKVEIPVTTADPGRVSQSLGFPPQTMLPPESGGTPPEGEDMNGAMNQIARIVWWMMAGGAIPFDNTFAGNANINGYPNGARVVASDFSGYWVSTAENNTANPDTVGTGWVPGEFYGTTALAGLTNANVTLTPLQGAKPRITLAGTLTGNIQIIVPTWQRSWFVENNTTGAFTVTVKYATGAGIVVTQGSMAELYGDGTNVTLPQVQNATGRYLGTQRFTSSGTYNPSAGTKFVIVEVQAGGGGAGGTTAQPAGSGALSRSGSAGAYALVRLTSGFDGASIVVGAAGAAGTSTTPGGNGGASSFGSVISCQGGNGGAHGSGGTGVAIVVGAFATAAPTISSGTVLKSVAGAQGLTGVANSAGTGGVAGPGGASPLGIGGSGGTSGNGNVANPPGYGGGGGGSYGPSGWAATSGAAGGAGIVLVHEYA